MNNIYKVAKLSTILIMMFVISMFSATKSSAEERWSFEVDGVEYYSDECIDVDGVQYTPDMKVLYSYPTTRTAVSFEVPDTVTRVWGNINNKYLTSLTWGKNEKTFNMYAISHCTNIKQLHFPMLYDSYDFVLNDAGELYGLPNLESITADDTEGKYQVYKNALYADHYRNLCVIAYASESLTVHKNTEIVAQIDPTESYYKDNSWTVPVTNNFSAINLESGNEYFTVKDGVLYDKDMIGVVLFPSLKTSYTIPKKLVRVSKIFGTVHGSDDLGGVINYQDEDVTAEDPGDGKVRVYGYSQGGDCVACNLKKIVVASGNKHFKSKAGVLYTKSGKTLVAYPAMKRGTFTVPSSVTKISVGAFTQAKYMSTLKISGKVKNVDLFFDKCTSLKRITVAEGVKTCFIDINESLSKLKRIDLPKSLKSINGNYQIDGGKIYGYTGTGAKIFANNNKVIFVKR